MHRESGMDVSDDTGRAMLRQTSCGLALHDITVIQENPVNVTASP